MNIDNIKIKIGELGSGVDLDSSSSKLLVLDIVSFVVLIICCCKFVIGNHPSKRQN